MIKNYFKTAWRSLKHNKSFSAINIIGLTIGLCACMLIATVVVDDLSYDRQWKRSHDIYRIISINKMGDGLYDRSSSSFNGLKTELPNNFPEVEAASGISNYKQRFKFSNTDANGINVQTLRVDTSIWRMLDVQAIAGNPKNYLAGDNGNLVITESLHKKFFPNENPVGKIIYDVPTYSDKPSAYIITGVIKDLPDNSVFRSDVWKVEEPRREELYKQQYGGLSENYVLLKPGTDMEKFTAKVNKWYAGFVTVKNPYQHSFQPLKDVYLHSDFTGYQTIEGDYKNIFILSGVAVLLLLVACVNFVNLSTARALQRLKETGVRKILGAQRKQLVLQFLTEAFLYFFISALLATLFYQLSLPLLKQFIEHELVQAFTSAWPLLLACYGIILIISIVAGMYPAFVLSAFKPAATLKGELIVGTRGSQHFVRKGLVVLQFAISIIVIVALIVVQQQVNFLKTKDIGYNTQNLLSIGSVSWDGKGEAFKNEVLRQPGVESASITSWLPTHGAGYMSTEVDDPNRTGNKLRVWSIKADVDLLKVMGVKLEKGRFLDKSYGSDIISTDSIERMGDSASRVNLYNQKSSIITAYTAKRLQVKSLAMPIPQVHTAPVGIIKDFNNESLKELLKPTIITSDMNMNYGGMLIRVQPGKELQAGKAISILWRDFFPDKFLDFNAVDEQLADEYEEESRLQQLFTVFSTLSMFLAALGILGLIIQATARRKKEIGIRKVLGASVSSIVQMFSIDFVKLILIAVFIASPLAWWLMSKWLQDFAYRIGISGWVFVVAGMSAILVALITISFQSIKSAMANPLKSLRTE